MNKLCYIAAIFFLVLSVEALNSDNCLGCISLDEHNFYKVVPKFEAILVKFDTTYPYGGKTDVFNALSSEIIDVPNLVLGQVPIKDYGERENEEFSKRFGVNKDNLPALRLFVQGEDEPFVFEKKRMWNNENLKKFIRDHTNIYLGLPGCIEAFDKLANRYASGEDKEKVLIEMEHEANKLTSEKDKEISKVYIKTMRKIIEIGDSFVKQERTRLENILQGKLNEKKKRELSNRINVLKAFNIPLKKTEL